MPATELTPGTIDYEGTGGHGPVIVLPGGVLMVGSVWEPVVAKLRHDHRCVVSMPPLGSPGRPMRADADLSLRGFGRIAAALLERLDLREVTLVGNDHAAVPALTGHNPGPSSGWSCPRARRSRARAGLGVVRRDTGCHSGAQS
jgi:hypothetical protein